MAGVKCPKLLWWSTYEPEAPELTPSPQQQAVFDRGHEVGELARSYRPGGVLIDFPHTQIEARLRATASALAHGEKIIYEASFLQHDIFVAVDILERVGRGAVLTEVKATLDPKPEHIPDLAVQAHVLGAAGIRVKRAEVMHLNRACVAPDLSNLFTRADVTSDVRAATAEVPSTVARLQKMLAGALPQVEPGDHCTKPHRCPFYDRCHVDVPRHHVSTLYRLTSRKAESHVARGIVTLDQIAPDTVAPGPQRRQIESVRRRKLIVEPGLHERLRSFAEPIAFLDFETINPPVPVWNGCSPYRQLPVQMSCHVLSGKTLRHHEWLADGPCDQRSALASAVLEACKGAKTIVVYNASFERRILQMLADAVPQRRGALARLTKRLDDLLPLVRDHVYHPDFQGSFGLKSVLPALVPTLRHDVLAIASGDHASVELEKLLLKPATDAASHAQRRNMLLEYCHLDTLGMVEVFRALRRLSTRRATFTALRPLEQEQHA